VVVTFENDDPYNVSWTVRPDEMVRDTLHLSLDELARAGAPLTVLGIRALYDALGDQHLVPALERGNLHQLREYIRRLNDPDADTAEGIDDMSADDALEGAVVH
jgi:hypothetical protein